MLILPDELLVQLSSWVPANDLSNLRLVCNRLGDVLACQVFRTIRIDMQAGRVEQHLHRLRALAQGYPLAARGGRHLHVGWLWLEPPRIFGCRTPRPPRTVVSREEFKQEVEMHLLKALSTLRGLKSIHLNPTLPPGLGHLNLQIFHLSLGFSGLRSISFSLTSALLSQPFPSTLPSLHTLEVVFDLQSPADAKKAITELTRLVDSSPSLSYISLRRSSNGTKWRFPSPHGANILAYASSTHSYPIRELHFSNVPFPIAGFAHHFRNLNVLSVECDGARSDYRAPGEGPDEPDGIKLSSSLKDLWQNLRLGRIWVQSVSVDDACDDFLLYVESYSTLHSLTIRRGRYADKAAADKAAARFYQVTLPRHSPSLRNLHIHSAYEGAWSFSEINWETMKKCINLTELSVDVRYSRRPLRSLRGPTDLHKVITYVAQCLPRIVSLCVKDALPELTHGVRQCVMGFYGHDRQLHAEARAYRAPQDCTRLPKLAISRDYWYEPRTKTGEDGTRVLCYRVVAKSQRTLASWEPESDVYSDDCSD